ncbi:MAG: ATP-binding protein, partial [Oligoflexia bacterium]|nr:ATP-binding protein [Oligoflexia bacterium]
MAKYCQKLKEPYPVVLITGPRQSGKTTFSREYYKQLPYVNLEELQIREMAHQDPKGLIAKYPKGAIFDEIQKAPALTSYLQGFVDEESFKGQFILTGSQNFSVMNTLSQSLAGRATLLHLLPFSLFELSHYTNIEDLEELLYRGFYPRISHRNLNPTNAYGDYLSTYLERDIRQLELIKKLSHFQRFVKLSAGRIGQIINYNSLSNDVGVSVSTIQEWLTLLEASYIIFHLPPFFENIGKRLIKQPKLYFYDVGLVSY